MILQDADRKVHIFLSTHPLQSYYINTYNQIFPSSVGIITIHLFKYIGHFRYFSILLHCSSAVVFCLNFNIELYHSFDFSLVWLTFRWDGGWKTGSDSQNSRQSPILWLWYVPFTYTYGNRTTETYGTYLRISGAVINSFGLPKLKHINFFPSSSPNYFSRPLRKTMIEKGKSISS